MTDAQILDRMRRLCSRREYSEGDILQKITLLCNSAGDSEDPSRLLDILKKENYVSDVRYATAFARDKASLQGWGILKIRYALSAKGISKGVIDAALGEIDASAASDKLEKVLVAKARSLKEDPQIKLKLIRFALGRGYQYDEVAPKIEQMLKLQ